jgi:MFS transporter, DHA1 family, multidrug resistance protein
MQIKPPFFTLLLLISFASVNAVLFTPALPEIAHFFHINNHTAGLTITWFLIGYALGQLLYGPIANRFGRKPALYAGIGLQIISSLICVCAGLFHAYWLLILGRFLLALGSGVGLKMTFTLINECYEPKIATEKISYLMLAFAITPSLGVALGGILTTYFEWTSCFYASAIYGVILLMLVMKLTETQTTLDLSALKLSHLLKSYQTQFKDVRLVSGGLLIGSTTCFIYLFSALGPFVAMNLLGMNSAEYGFANIIPSLGLILGSLIGARLTKRYPLTTILKIGVIFALLGVLYMIFAVWMHASVLISFFLPLVIIYFGLCLILPNASTLAMSHVKDKSHGSAVMNFLNMGLTTLVVLCVGYIPITLWLLPLIYLFLTAIMTGLFFCLTRFSRG